MNDVKTQIGGEVQNHLEIDDMLVAISVINTQIEDYKQLKKHRTAPIDREIEELEKAKEAYRLSISYFMSKNNEKILKYPGIAKVTCKTGQDKWVIDDENKLFEFLTSIYSIKELEDIGVYKIEHKLVKKEADKLLSSIENKHQIPINTAHREEGKNIISISFEDDGNKLLEKTKEMKQSVIDSDNASVSKKQNFDELEF